MVNESVAISAELSTLLCFGAIVVSMSQPGKFISNKLTRIKANGKVGIVLNLEPLNQFCMNILRWSIKCNFFSST